MLVFLVMIKTNLGEVSESNLVGEVSPKTISAMTFRFISYLYYVLQLQDISGLSIFNALKYHSTEMLSQVTI